MDSLPYDLLPCIITHASRAQLYARSRRRLCAYMLVNRAWMQCAATVRENLFHTRKHTSKHSKYFDAYSQNETIYWHLADKLYHLDISPTLGLIKYHNDIDIYDSLDIATNALVHKVHSPVRMCTNVVRINHKPHANKCIYLDLSLILYHVNVPENVEKLRISGASSFTIPANSSLIQIALDNCATPLDLQLPMLRELYITGFSQIMDSCVSRLTNLTELGLCENTLITNNAVSCLHGLTKLNLAANQNITGDVFQALTNIGELILRDNQVITNEDISTIPTLHTLILGGSCIITQLPTQLHTLSLNDNSSVVDEALMQLTGLTQLNLSYDQLITDSALMKLTTLIDLNIGLGNNITDEPLYMLTNLERLYIQCNNRISAHAIRSLPRLKCVHADPDHLIHQYLNVGFKCKW